MADKENVKGANAAKQSANAGKSNANMIITIAAVIVVLAAAYFYLSMANGTPKNGVPPVQVNQTDTQAAKLLLASFDNEGALKDYSVAYSDTDSGGTLNYQIEKNASNSWVEVEGGFGSMQGFFGANNTTDIVCLDYANTTRCTMAGKDAHAQNVANTLRVYLFDSKTDSTLKAQTIQLIQAGVITFSPVVADGQVGQFETKKISYTLDYSHLTLQQMASLGIANDQSLASISNWTVSLWIDKATGMNVKSQASYSDGGALMLHNREYSRLALGTPALPAAPGALVSVGAFSEFYQISQADYSAVLSCEPLAGSDRDGCYKSVATDRNSYSLCQKISDQKEFESCALIVASATNQSAYCQNLTMLADDCYISVAGNTGDYSLCQNLMNASLVPVCSQAAAQGKQIAEAAAAAAQARENAKNCVADTDCKMAGNEKQYCVPASSNITYPYDNAPENMCLNGIPCGCQSGFCGFAKNETYYACLSNVEDALLQQFIVNESNKGNATPNMTGTANSSVGSK